MDDDKKTPKEMFADLRRREEEELARTLAPKHGIQYIDLSRVSIDLDSLQMVPEEQSRALSLAIINSVGKKLQIVVTNPDRPGVQEFLEDIQRKQYKPELFLTSPTSMEKAFQRYKEVPKFEAFHAGIVDLSKGNEQYIESLRTLPKVKSELTKILEEQKGSAKLAITVLEIVLASALSVETSDVHLEGEELAGRLRFRIDGVLQDVIDLPKELYSLIVSRLKLISEMKLNVKDKPQDGRFTIITTKEKIEVRNSMLPGPNGESIVMRLLLPKAIETTFEKLGMQPQFQEMMKIELDKPHGMILTTGPTGSGKTTTLYAFLKKMASPEVKVITIEDPIEYHIPHITQTQVDHSKGYTFASGLRSIVRQDPDIVLVGEIRDLETAEIAIQAALTGHLVLSTLHTNSAAGIFPRLIDIGVKPNLIAPAINVGMAQRLLRRLCQHCKKQIPPSGEEKTIIEKQVSQLPKNYTRTLAPDFQIWKGEGCEECNFTGYKGRVGIYEAFLIDDAFERMVLSNPPEADIQKAAIEQGMLTMYQDGVLKILDGITTLDELHRIVSVD
jgi:type IV pilus assembly protein PilB